jgi:hypothetical protein
MAMAGFSFENRARALRVDSSELPEMKTANPSSASRRAIA